MFTGPSWSDGIRNLSDPITPLCKVSGKVGSERGMARHSQAKRRIPHWWAVAVMVSTASAVSLNDLQPLSEGILPLACSIAYNATLLGCYTADFASGSHCSEGCEVGIEIIEEVIDGVCSDVDASQNSVLGFAQRGVLIRHVCEGNDVTLPQPTSTTAAPITTTISIVLTTSSPQSSDSSTSAPRSTFVTSTSTSVLSSTSTTQSPSVTHPRATTNTDSTIQPSTSLQTTSQPVSQSSSTSSSAKTSTTATTPGNDGEGRGGGSPFDAQVSQSSRYSISWPLWLSVGVILLGTSVR